MEQEKIIKHDINDFKKQSFDIVLVAGQSNADGCGVGPVEAEYVPDDDILWMLDDLCPRYVSFKDGGDYLKTDYPVPPYISVAQEPFIDGAKRGKLAFKFSELYKKSGLLQKGRKLLIVHAAVGATGFCKGQWTPGGVLQVRMTALTKAALKLGTNSKIVALLWHQGECDSVENPNYTPQKRYDEYVKAFSRFIEVFRFDFSAPDVPLIAGGFCNEWYCKNKEICDPVIKALKDVCESDACGAFVETGDLLSNNQKTGNGDEIHFCRNSLNVLGERYFKAYLQLKK